MYDLSFSSKSAPSVEISHNDMIDQQCCGIIYTKSINNFMTSMLLIVKSNEWLIISDCKSWLTIGLKNWEGEKL